MMVFNICCTAGWASSGGWRRKGVILGLFLNQLEAFVELVVERRDARLKGGERRFPSSISGVEHAPQRRALLVSRRRHRLNHALERLHPDINRSHLPVRGRCRGGRMHSLWERKASVEDHHWWRCGGEGFCRP